MNNNLPPTLAREYALKFLYHIQLSEFKDCKKKLEAGEQYDASAFDTKLNLFHESYSEQDLDHPDNALPPEALFFAKHLILNFISNYKYLVEIAQKNSKGWKKENIDKIDLTIILLAICEMRFSKDTPKKVIINEAINMAKKYGKEESFAFVNGILDSILNTEFCN